MDLLGAAIVSGIANLAGSIITNISNKKNVESTNQHSEDLWHEQTNYNSPINQMLLARKAGLNPNLVATNIATNGTAANAPALLSHQNQNPVQLDPLTAAQVRNLDSQTQLNNSNARKTNEETRPLVHQNDIMEFIDSIPNFRNLKIGETFYDLTVGQSKEFAKIISVLADSDISRTQASQALYNFSVVSGIVPPSESLDPDYFTELFGEFSNITADANFQRNSITIKNKLLKGDSDLQDIAIEYNGIIRDMAKLQYDDSNTKSNIRGTIERRLAQMPDNLAGNLLRLFYLFITEQSKLNFGLSN